MSSGMSIYTASKSALESFCITMAREYAKRNIIINGIEVDGTVKHIITKEHLSRAKRGCLLIDSAADAGNAIEGTHYTSIANPVYKEDGLWFYEVNNAPSLLYRRTSYEISKSFSQWVYKEDVKRFLDLL